jgi:hypothetical protein
VVRDVLTSQGEPGAGRECGSRDRRSDRKAAPTGAGVPAADDVDELRLRVEICRSLRETAAQQRGDVVVS